MSECAIRLVDRDPSRVSRCVAVIGAGPRGIGWLERFAANEAELGSGPVVVHLIDPFPIGAGRIWRDDQPGLLRVNSTAADVTVFTDDSCRIEGPVRPGPSLADWAAGVRAGTIVDVDVDPGREPALAAELAALDGDDYPSRRLHARYLDWFARRTIGAVRHGSRVVRHATRAERVVDRPDGTQRVELATGDAITVDLVVYALGHAGRVCPADERGLDGFAARHDATYVPPAFTADVPVDDLDPGDAVIVRGMGLSAIDLVTLLGEGRGGRFVEQDDGRLRYEPSGREPRLWLGSRRGVPYHAITTVPPAVPVEDARALTAPAVRALARAHGRVDYHDHVRPLLLRELLLAHYREVVVAADARATGEAPRWPAFRARFDRTPIEGAAFEALIAAYVPDPSDRVDPARFDEPLGGSVVGGLDDLQARVRAHVLEEVARHETPGSGEAGLLEALTRARFVIDEVADEPFWTARSIEHGLPAEWRGLYDFVSCGPPARRLRELVALSEAGIVGFLGGGIGLECDEATGEFVVRGADFHGEVRARALVDAWQPAIDAATTDDPALIDLLASGAGRVRRHSDGERASSTGRLEVRIADARVVRADGTAHPRRFAIGAYTSAPFVGAFSRPGSDAASFRENDVVARAVLRELAALRGVEPGDAPPTPPGSDAFDEVVLLS